MFYDQHSTGFYVVPPEAHSFAHPSISIHYLGCLLFNFCTAIDFIVLEKY